LLLYPGSKLPCGIGVLADVQRLVDFSQLRLRLSHFALDAVRKMLGQLAEAIDITRVNGLCFIHRKEVDLMQAYCVKCHAKREMKDAKAITMKNGKPATQGVCPICGTKMFRIGKS